MWLSPSAHVDTFCRDRLPPQDQWPEFLYDLPQLRYPERLNCAAELLDATAAREGDDRPCLRSPAAAWLAVIKAGGVVVTTMALLRPREIATIVGLTEPSLAICDYRFAEDLAAGAPELTTIRYGDPDDPEGLAARCAAQDGAFTPVLTAADDVAMLASTSGTTGQPKVAMHFHRDVLATCDTFSHYLIKPHRDDVFTGTPPLGFTYGLGGLLLYPLRSGASTLLIERATPAELADAIAAHGVTVLSTAPIAYRAMLAAGKASSLENLRRCISAGEHLPKSVWEDFHEATGIAIIDGIGSTEMLHIFICAADEDIRPGSTGRAVPGYRATILDSDGAEVPDGQPGRLAVKGPTGCRYLSDPRQRNYVQHGWNITGDTYTRDADGYYWYQARSDDMIISAGYNIAGLEVEEALLGHPDVLEVAVIGAPDADRGMIVQAYVVLRDPAAASPDKAAELQEFAKQSIAPYKYPRGVEFVTELPKTISGKTQRYRLRQLAEEKLRATPR